jgi:protein ImuB
MSVLCCRIPDFLLALAYRQNPGWAGRPVALLGPDERVWAASPEAQREGVQVQMRPPQAQLCCRDLLLRPLDVAACQAEQDAFLATVATWELPVEPQEWGAAYVDLHTLASTRTAVQPLALELGRAVRTALGEPLQPALGWDSGKFTARAAATQASPGRLRLVDKADEVRFLAPLPISLLPLPAPHRQQLHWLGIRTLGQFAALPPAAVWQRFGAAGKLAQQWAQGKDRRPVCGGVPARPGEAAAELDPPAHQLQPVVNALLASLQPALARWAKQLEGLRHLRVQVAFVGGATRTLDLTFVEPASQPGRVQAALVQRLCASSWPAPVQSVRWQALATGELAAPQLSLLTEPVSPAPRLVALNEVAHKLLPRYGTLFFRAAVADPRHPIPERRASFQGLCGDLHDATVA